MLWHTSNWDVLLLSFWPWPFYLEVKFRLNQIINIVNKYCPDRNFERLQTWNIYTGRLWWEESEWYPQFYFDLFFISRSILFWKIFLKSEQEYLSSYSLYTCTIYRWYKTYLIPAKIADLEIEGKNIINVLDIVDSRSPYLKQRTIKIPGI